MDFSESFFGRHKILSAFLILLLVLLGVVALRLRGPHRAYRIDYVKTGEGTPGVLKVGVAKRDITPDLSFYDTYNDIDNDNRYRKDKGDTYNDLNNNGKFDAVWIAGYNNNRPAKGINDKLWARAIAFQNNGVTTVVVSIDSIGLFQEVFIDVRKSLDPALSIDHVILSSLHDHEAPDTMGLWNPNPLSGKSFDYGYLTLIKNSCKQAIEEAVKNLQPAEMTCAVVDIDPKGFVDDSRKPTVIDTKINCMRLTKPGTDETIATVVNWGNHPETLGGNNPLLTSDFSHYWRAGVEDGVPEPNGVKGLGGMCIYVQGMVGGLMTQLHTTVPGRDGVKQFREDTFEKAQALGENLAIKTVNALRAPTAWKNETPRLAVAAKTIYIPLAGTFKWAMAAGLIHPGIFGGFTARTEIDAVRLGEVEMLTIPGELYPEIADGGIEAPEGRDFMIDPIEVPPLRTEVMKGKMRMIIGLANDEIGYIIPKSQWDAKSPHAYDPKGQYGEENSGGPEVGPTIHHEAKALLERLHDALPK